MSSTGHDRRGLLRQLNYNIGLPTHGDSREDHATNEGAFGSALQSICNLLASWDKDYEDGSTTGKRRPNLQLHLWLSYDIDTHADGPVDHAFDVGNSSAARRYHTVLPQFHVPRVQRVTSLVISATLGRTPHPATLCQIASLLPSLESLDLTYWDPAVKRHDLRKEHRVALGNGLRALATALPRLERLCVRRREGVDPLNHSFVCGDLLINGEDALCDAIRRLAVTCRLKELLLENFMISPDLFQNSLPVADQESPLTFPDLKRLDIKSGILAASGEWYYTGDPASLEASEDHFIEDDDDDTDGDVNSEDSGDEDSSTRDRFVNGERPAHEWRTRPDPETFDPLIRDLTDAMLKRMPSLQWASLEIGGELNAPVGIIIQWCEAGQPFVQPLGERGRRPWVEDVTVRRCKACVGNGAEWEVPLDVMGMWREWAGTSGSVAVVVWL